MNADDLTVNIKNEVYNDGQIWQDGWYIYGKGEVTGPYLAEDIFPEKKAKSYDDAGYLVSRKGLNRWYDYPSLSRLYEKENEEQNQLSIIMKKNGSSEKSKTVSNRKNSHIKTLGRSKNTNHSNASSQLKTESRPNKDLGKRNQSRKSIDYYHMILRGRLRLGGINDPWLAAFVKFPFTLGLFFKAWYEQALIEASYHIDDPHGTDRLKRVWLVLVPGVHMFMVYRLSKLILQMEVQNRYRYTSPILAFIFSIIPPFSIYYLQKSLNRHWYLHVHHHVSQQKPSDSLGEN